MIYNVLSLLSKEFQDVRCVARERRNGRGARKKIQKIYNGTINNQYTSVRTFGVSKNLSLAW